MTPGARIAAAIEVLDRILDGDPAEAALLRWSRASRFAGSGDRAAVRDLVFGALRQRNTLAALGGGLTGRGLMIGLARAEGRDPQALFTGTGHAPAPLTEAEAAHAATPPGPLADLPEWLHPAWRASLGDRAEAVAATMGQRAPVWLRANLARGPREAAAAALATDGVLTEPGAGASALRVTEGERRVAASSAYRDGLVELQDLSPQLACEALPLAPGMRVLDYCAGGGGKVLALAARQPGATFFAHDAAPQRLKDLPARAARAGARVSVLPRVTGRFDLVVADVPCSGSGTWRRSPDARWRTTPQDLDRLLVTQAQILRDVARMVAQGGHLAYMTCSLLDDENDSQISRFLSENPEFDVATQRLWTPLEAGDGFFLSLLLRQGDG
ncbi:RsmB/NOP family class I SAM-dependent RNA methyltransferase [Paracoccus sp. (in: a-proteobacteria)]|uniref:RsmB/NOP family class I SAM-dependent RNA methyltransferase n=1 Tax=Paracoccus sp. TaxID=267 RepID=UPI00272BAA71|nr:RsmB/NOP family class I SAM-dependent RNA methyltransferase [Paracoccus sp. (in: a-proteobacteria)]